MSISLTIDNPTSDEDRLITVPVATEQVFRTYWAPACAALGLTIIDAFPVGVVIGASEVPALLNELQRLQAWIAINVEVETATRLERRIATLVRELPGLASHGRRVFIG